jgi:hypothetical protein
MLLPVVAGVLLGIGPALPLGAAPRMTAETPQISGGGEASGRPLPIDQPPPGPTFTPGPLGRVASPYGVIGPSFVGFGYDDNFTESAFRTVPPTPNGAAGTTRLVAVVSSMIEVRTKSGVLVARDALKDFYGPLAGCAILTFPFDPKVTWDPYQSRFVVVALERANAGVNPSTDNLSRILVAVSKSGAPASLTSADWWFHCIDSKVATGGVEYWTDFPGVEVDEEAIYITNNLFSFPGAPSAYGGSRLWIVHKGAVGGLYAGGPATVTVRDPYVLGGSIATTTMPAAVYGTGGVAPGVGTYLVSYGGITDGTNEYVQVIRVNDPLGAAGGPSFTGPDFVSLGDLESLGAGLPDAPQPATAQTIEVNDRRALDAVWRNHALWLVATVTPDGTGQPALPDHTTAWWIALDASGVTGSASPTGLLTLADQGGIAGEDIAGLAGGDVYTFFPSVAVNSSGTAAFGFSASGTNVYAGAYATLRRASDPAGSTDPAVAVHQGVDSYVRTLDGPPCDAPPAHNRWGDYSGISVDPVNEAGFWVFNQFADFRGSPSTGGCNGRPDPEDGRWGTAWGLLGHIPSVTLGNATVVEGNAGTVTLTFTVTASFSSIADIRADLATLDGFATAASGDYVAKAAPFTIPAGSTSGTFVVTVNGDLTPETNETMYVTMSNLTNALRIPGGGKGTIQNDDGTTAVGPEVADLGLRALTPNPGHGPARLELSLPQAGPVDLSLMDVQGQRVAQLASGVRPAGRHEVVWDPGQGARRAPAGIYFARLVTPAGQRLLRLVLL